MTHMYGCTCIVTYVYGCTCILPICMCSLHNNTSNITIMYEENIFELTLMNNFSYK